MSENRMPVIVRFIITAFILIAAIYVFATMLIIPGLKKKAASYATQKAVEVIVRESGARVEQEQIKEIYETLPEEDRQTVESIVEEHINAQTAAEVTTYLQNRDKEGLKQYAEETLSEEELQELKQLYDKYKDQIDAEAFQ
ncbi:MAG: hypothetical protein IJR58_02555 [Lachnospiraceae bacterium]|nr:hypothetical protein [Lachnospiraceae bacterium]